MSVKIEDKLCTCAGCGNEFLTHHKRQYCSVKCRNESQFQRERNDRMKLCKCQYCKKEFIGNGVTKHCSTKCAKDMRTLQVSLNLQAWKVRNNKYSGLSVKIYVNTCRVTGQFFVTRKQSANVSKEGKEIIIKRKTHRNCKRCGKSFLKFINGVNLKLKYCDKCSHDAKKDLRNQHKAVRRSNEIKGERIVRERVFERFGYLCAYCGVNTFGIIRGINHPHEPTIDHVIPLSKGGIHAYSNVQLLCRQCNTNKSNRTPRVVNSRLHLRSKIVERSNFSARNVEN